jgi:hypothetical protein
MNYLIPVYAAYGATSLVLTVWLARVLFDNGAVFLSEVFGDNKELARAVNRLLVVGFYLLNFSYACLILPSDPVSSLVAAIEVGARKLGLLLLTLGIMHFFNMYLFHRMRRRAKLATMPPPVLPHARITHDRSYAAAESVTA